MPPQRHIPQTVALGGVVAITAADYGGLGAVRGTLSAGSGYVSSDLDDEEVQASGQWVGFTLEGGRPSTYIVNPPSEAGRANHMESPDCRWVLLADWRRWRDWLGWKVDVRSFGTGPVNGQLTA